MEGLILEFYGIVNWICRTHLKEYHEPVLDQSRCEGNCLPTPPLSQHFALSEK